MRKTAYDLTRTIVSIISGQPIVFENRPSSDSKYRVTAGVLRDVLDKIRFTSPEDGEKVRLIFFQALGFEVDNPLLRKLAGLPLHQEECEQASNNRNKMGDALPVPRTSQTPQNQSQEVVSKRQIDGEPSARRKWPRRGLEATAKSHRSAMLNESHSPTQPTQPTQPLEEPPNSARDGLLASDNQHDNTQSGVGSQGGSPREADHDIEQCRLTRQGYEERLAAMQAEIEELRRSDNHLLQCGLAWRKERDQLRDRLARST